MKTVEISVELLDELIEYVKNKAEVSDAEWGEVRDWDEILADGDMEEMYFKLVAVKEKL